MKIAGVLLAAGRGTRFDPEDEKLMADIDGRWLVDWAAEALVAAGLSPRVAVVQDAEDDPLAIILEADHVFHPIENPRFADGIGTSIAAAAVYLQTLDVDGAVIALGDMPFVRPETYRAMIAAFAASGGRAIVAATEGGRRSSPTLFPRALFPALAALGGDEGARTVVAANAALAVEVECQPGELDDIDTKEALKAALARLRR